MKLERSLVVLRTALVLSSLLLSRVASPAATSREHGAPAPDAKPEGAVTHAPGPASKAEPRVTVPKPASPRVAPESVHPLRRLLKKETTRAIAQQARAIIDAHWRSPIGTEIPFQADGEEYVARIEVHYHPPGGDKKPWGEHPGVSVFVARP